MSLLIFIDTNIFLDFYRLRSREAGLSILKKLEQRKSAIITTDQVAMEFKKNRQRVLLETHRSFKAPDWASLALPPLLTETKASRALEKHKKAVTAHSSKVKSRLSKVLTRPSSYDPVYQSFQRIVNQTSNHILDRKKSERAEVRELAEKRFRLGYPPRKDNDSSFGDAINWEWIVRCCINSKCGVVIVTRDNDYGAAVDGKPILNDWLREEFRERVSKKRRIVLTDRITEGLRQLAIPVTKQEDDATKYLVREETPMYASDASNFEALRAFVTGSAASEPRVIPSLRQLLSKNPSDPVDV